LANSDSTKERNGSVFVVVFIICFRLFVTRCERMKKQDERNVVFPASISDLLDETSEQKRSASTLKEERVGRRICDLGMRLRLGRKTSERDER
jgi:hypothetical protein